MPSRRTYLAAVAAVAAGCVAQPPGGETDGTEQSDTRERTSTQTATSTVEGMPALGPFVLWNKDETEHELTLHVSRNGSVLVNETVTLGATNSRDVDNPISDPGTYHVTVSLSNGESAEYEWSLTCRRAPEYLQIRVVDGGRVEIHQMRTTTTTRCRGTEAST